MKYLLDTCVLSELVRKSPEPAVVKWVDEQDEEDLYISVLTMGELVRGIERLSDSKKKARLRSWLEKDLCSRFEGRVLPVDVEVAAAWGAAQALAERAGEHVPAIDGLIAATALAGGMTVVTRNTLER
ncbi:MAG: type II toxin-antitoxin system VapC family toxin [Deltaproteobacteria bacterium]|nr:type II toxin-antitoxin system VapC family toxin [Deltaproteobacteria bacterium]